MKYSREPCVLASWTVLRSRMIKEADDDLQVIERCPHNRTVPMSAELANPVQGESKQVEVL